MGETAKQRARVPGPWVAVVGVAAVVALHLRYRVDPRLLYQAQQPVHSTDVCWRTAILGRPGGGAELLGGWLGQFLCQPWVGTGVLVGMVGLCWLATAAIVRLLSGRWRWWPAALPGIFLIALHQADYGQPLAPSVALLGALAALALYLAVRRVAGTVGRVLAMALIASAALVWAGAPAVGVVACGALVEALARPRRLRASVAQASIGIVLLGVAAPRAFAVPWRQVATAQLVAPALASGSVSAWLLYASVVGLTAVAARGATAVGRGGMPGQERAPATAALRERAIAVLVAAVLAVVLWVGPDGRRREVLRVSWLSEARRWDEVLAQVPRLQAYAPATVYQVQRALYHRGELLERMFAYPLLPGEGIFDASPDHLDRLTALADVFLDLGLVNGAEQMAHEALEVYGDRPSLLQRLVRINLAKGRPAAAQVFLGRLERGMVLREWAAACRQALARDATLAQDSTVARARAWAPAADRVDYVFSPEGALRELLAHEPRNRMAYEYLMAHYLLTGQVAKAAGHLQRLDDFASVYPRPLIPRHCEEALLLLLAATPGQQDRTAELVPSGREIRPQTLAAFDRFCAITTAHQNDRARLLAALEHDLRDTYWRYFVAHAPAARQQESAIP